MTRPLQFSDAHGTGLCSVAYLPAAPGGGGGLTLVTAGPDGRLCYRSPDAPGGEPQKVAENSLNGAAVAMHCVAAAAGRPVITGDNEHFVKASSRRGLG